MMAIANDVVRVAARVLLGAGAVTAVTVLLVFLLAFLAYVCVDEARAKGAGRLVASVILRVYALAGLLRLCWEIGAWLRP
jgi:hypothetical protein